MSIVLSLLFWLGLSNYVWWSGFAKGFLAGAFFSAVLFYFITRKWFSSASSPPSA